MNGPGIPAPRARPVPPKTDAFGDLPAGGNWEGGTVDRAGRRWVHYPWRGWQLADPQPWPRPPGRVYASRRRRYERSARLTAAVGLPVAAGLMYAGASRLSLPLAVAGLTLAACLTALLWWGTRAAPR